mmetsp:Transcript_27131/g.41025  ORF Transcript_27131/g.41025 Transcript_27131/m.41025 type:complete len:101 (+) Transcript_27131:3-305(+)
MRPELPSCRPNFMSAGYANHMKTQPIWRHYASLKEELEELRTRLRVAPEITKANLRADDSWHYYAVALRQAEKNDALIRKEQKKRASSVLQQPSLPPIGH